MSKTRRIAYGIGGFSLSVVVALTMVAGLQILFSVLWTRPSSFLLTYGSMIAIVSIAIASTWVCLLQSLRNEAMIRGVWCHIYTLVAIAAISLILTVWI